MLANMASSLLKHKRINTTVAKAKALRGYIEPLLTKAKSDTTHSRRMVFKYLKDKYAVTELFRDVAPKIANRPGGYTRIFKTGNRLGDNAEMCLIELVDFNETLLAEPKTGAGVGEKKKRTRRGSKKKEIGDDTKKTKSTKESSKNDVAEDVEIIEETNDTPEEEKLKETPQIEDVDSKNITEETEEKPDSEANSSADEKEDNK